MRSALPISRSFLFVFVSFLVWAPLAFAQERCLSDEEIAKMVTQVNSPQGVMLNKKLRSELLKLRDRDQESVQKNIAATRKSEAMMNRMRASRAKNSAALCPLLKQFGWPTAALAGQDGEAAAFLLLRNGASPQLQKDLLPVIIAAVKRDEIPRADFARYLDRVRLSLGLKQMFGTQVTVADGFLVLYPIEAEAQVDQRRQQYGLEPLNDFLRFVEGVYHRPL